MVQRQRIRSRLFRLPSDPACRPGPVNMTHELVKRMLQQAQTFEERAKAIKTALDQGMPLYEIEEFLDWLDMNRSQPEGDQSED